VASVQCVLVAVVHVVNVVVVGGSVVTAALAVSMVVDGVLGDAFVLVVVVVVQGVVVRAVNIVNVVVMVDGFVTTGDAVFMLGDAVFCMEFEGAHDCCSFAGSVSSSTCAIVSSITCAMWWSARR